MFGIQFTFCEKYSTQQQWAPGLFPGSKVTGTWHWPPTTFECSLQSVPSRHVTRQPLHYSAQQFMNTLILLFT